MSSTENLLYSINIASSFIIQKLIKQHLIFYMWDWKLGQKNQIMFYLLTEINMMKQKQKAIKEQYIKTKTDVIRYTWEDGKHSNKHLTGV